MFTRHAMADQGRFLITCRGREIKFAASMVTVGLAPASQGDRKEKNDAL